MNRGGKCPRCSLDWDGGDIVDTLAELDVFSNSPRNFIEKVASEGFGWNPFSPKRFSKLIDVKRGDAQTCMCPRCKSVWNGSTGEMIKSSKEQDVFST